MEKNQHLLIILFGYTIIVIFSLYIVVDISLTKREILQNDFVKTEPTGPTRHLSQSKVPNKTVSIFNTTVAPSGYISGMHRLIPAINCSSNLSLPAFKNQSQITLKGLAQNKDFITLLIQSSASSNQSVADHFITILCKPGTSLPDKYNRTLVELIEATVLTATVTPAQTKRDIRKYYHNIINQEVFNLHCPTCALVSSSGRILGSNVGDEIDNHTCVVRMNTAPVKGFEKDVGSRTTVRVGSFVTVMGMKRNNYLYIFGAERGKFNLYWGLDKEKQKKWLTQLKKDTKTNGTHTGVFFQQSSGEDVLNHHFFEMTGLDRIKSKSWLSTGWFTLELLLDMCDNIDVYGMVPEDYCQKHKEDIKYHYYQDKPKPTECGVYEALEKSKGYAHRFMTEKAVFAKWGAEYNISFFHPTWNISQEAAKDLNTPFIKNQKKQVKPVKKPLKVVRKKGS